MKFGLYGIPALFFALITLTGATPAQAHGGEGWILGILTGGAFTFFGLVLVGIIAVASLVLLGIVIYWLSLCYRRKLGNKFIFFVSLLLAPAMAVVILSVSAYGAIWYRVLTKPPLTDAQIAADQLDSFKPPPAGQIMPILPEDAARVRQLLLSAEGNIYDSLELGKKYRRGVGVPQDFAEAYFWLSVSLRLLGSPEYYPLGAADARDDSRARLTPEQAAAVDARLVEWQKKNRP